MISSVIERASDILARYAWAQELAGILPLSTLIDFVDIPRHFHAFQLIGSAPFWSWPITPANSRVLLSNSHEEKLCYLDSLIGGSSLLCLDGKYGDEYALVNSNTTQLCLSSDSTHTVNNLHKNLKRSNNRVQNLTVVHVIRRWDSKARGRLMQLILQHHGWFYMLVSSLGWVFWSALITATIILRCYIALAFLIIVPSTGYITWLIYGGRPRRLLVDRPSITNRLVVVTPHMNATDWMAFYGEKDTVNSLLNRPLEPSAELKSLVPLCLLKWILRLLIISQWALALAAASLKDWSAYFMTFWIALCIVTQSYLLRPSLTAGDWMKNCVRMEMKKYRIQLSGRIAMLNTIIALNPDTFKRDSFAQGHHCIEFNREALSWIDPILKPTQLRTDWEEATLAAMRISQQVINPLESECSGQLAMENWVAKYGEAYGASFIWEGIIAAGSIQQDAKLPGLSLTGLTGNIESDIESGR